MRNKPRFTMGNVNYHQPAALWRGKVYVGGGKGLDVYDLAGGGDQKIGGRPYGYNPPPWEKSICKPQATLAGPEGLVNTAVAVAGDFAFAGSDDGCVYSWDLAAGKVAWKHQTGGRVRSSPAVAGGRLYIGSDDGCVYCFARQ